ncbi:hypothetical protein GQ53DRAFT_767021 [Thozetella sp. PMI_491]|nr:hypothetical protein GQ53DRAFT_767021 [Thozetella sp. PMI_491]
MALPRSFSILALPAEMPLPVFSTPGTIGSAPETLAQGVVTPAHLQRDTITPYAWKMVSFVKTDLRNEISKGLVSMLSGRFLARCPQFLVLVRKADEDGSTYFYMDCNGYEGRAL